MHRKRPSSFVWTAVCAFAGLTFVACGGGKEQSAKTTTVQADASAEAPATPAARENKPGDGAAAVAGLQAGDATISGTITFVGKAPTFKPVAMDADPVCAGKHKEPVYPPVLVLGDGKTVGNMFVQVKGSIPQGDYKAPAIPVIINQEGCMYKPHVVGLIAGQPLEFWNSDGILHNVHLAPKENQAQNLAMSPNVTEKSVTLNTPELYVPVKCDVHPWMSAYVAVMSHPYFDVTEEDGRYEIRVPAGTYTVEVWHERLGTKSQQVTVAAGGKVSADFALDVPAR